MNRPWSFFRPVLRAALVALCAWSCSRQEADLLRVTSTLPSGTLERDAVIAISFSRRIAPPDSLNQWSSTPYVEFTPAVPGKFVWQDSSRLVFSPDGPLPGDTRFTGKLNTALLQRMAHAGGFSGPDEFQFSSPRFTLAHAEFFYDRLGEHREVGIKANLEFTYAVDPGDLSAHLRLTVDGEARQPARIVTTERNRTIALEVGPVTQREKERQISISVDDKLVSPETGTHCWLERPFVFTLPPLAELQIYGHEAGFDGATGWVRVTTSQEVDPKTVKQFITLDPVQEYTVEGSAQSFVLRGRFQPGTAFRMLIARGLESYLGGRTQHDYEANIAIGNIQPSFRFASASGVYMLLSGERKLEVRSVNVEKLNVRISQVFQNNLVFFLDGGRFYDYEYSDEEGGVRPGARAKYRYYLGNYGRQLSFDSITVRGTQNQELSTVIDLAPHLQSGYRGFYLVEIANTREPWRSTSKLVSVSDIGLVVKHSSAEVVVFATSLVSTASLKGVTVSLVSTNNQVIASGTTDGDGAVHLAIDREKEHDLPLKLVTAEREGDFNFINLADYRVETSRYDVAGKYDAQNVYDALLFGDRNLYRPGEKIIVAGLVRNLTHDLPAQMPVRLRLVSPRGSLVTEWQITLNEEGAFETSYQTQGTALTGEYRFELTTGTSQFLATYKVSVEDFVPDRLRVTLTPSREEARPGEKITYDLFAQNFFGPPAAGRAYQFEGSFDVVPFVSKRFPDFRFYDHSAKNYSGTPLVVDGRTDDAGKAKIEFPLPGRGQLTSTGLLRARGKVAVFDESGRPVYQIGQTLVYPREYFVGLRNRGAYYVSPNTPQLLEIVAVDPHDQPSAGFRARIQVIRSEWHSVLRQHQGTGTLRYVSEKREIVERTDLVTLADRPYEYRYAATRSGDYLVRVSREGQEGYNQIAFYAYSWGSTDITSFEVDPEARVEVVLDKPVYAPGDRAKVLFQAPFNGRMLVTVERNGVFSARYLDVVNNAASMELTIEERFLPTVYVSAVLFRRITDLAIPLLAGHGFAPVHVENPRNHLAVAIEAPERIRPRTRQSVTVAVADARGAMLTLAAVDEGILQLKNYKTPDPYAYFYARKALQTETFDFFRDLLPEPVKAKSSAGGSDAELSRRANPLGVQRFKPVSLWSGIVRTNGSGRTEVALDVPDFNGELRLMAFVWKGDRFGAAERAMKVSDPVVVTPALPRFLSPGDSAVMALTAFNTTASAVRLRFELTAGGGVSVSPRSPELEVGANQERYTLVGVKATERIGKAELQVRTAAAGMALESITELPVRPTAPFSAEGRTGFVEAGSSVTVEIPGSFLPYGRRAYLTLSPFPVAGLAQQLAHLIGYPHGCLEQTVSKAFPQIYLRDIAALLAPTGPGGSPTYFVNEAITKIAGMQSYDGAFLMWPGGGTTNAWTTIYATHFLLEARKAGYAVPEQTLKAALGAVGQIARGHKTEDYAVARENRVIVRRIADKSAVYALYVLAVAGVPEKPLMDFYRAERSLLTGDTQYLLAGAYALAGDRRAYTELLPSQFSPEEPQRTTGGNLDSPVRANALILNILLETDLNDPNIPRYMDYLSHRYSAHEWYSTQDDAFTLLAFGKAARIAAASSSEGTVTAGGKETAYRGSTQRIDLDPSAQKAAIALRGSGRVYYALVVEGIRTDGGTPLEDRNLQVRREYLDRAGAPVAMAALKQNDLVVVRVTLRSSVDLLENIAVTDLLPAGFEIENPRLTEMTQYAFIKDPTVPEYLDVRDDRINIYTSFRGANRRQQVFYYAMRAVTAGEFQQAPIVAEAMYNAGFYYSAHGRGVVHIAR